MGRVSPPVNPFLGTSPRYRYERYPSPGQNGQSEQGRDNYAHETHQTLATAGLGRSMARACSASAEAFKSEPSMRAKLIQ